MTGFSAVLSSTVLLPLRMLLGGVMSLSDAPLQILTHFWVLATVGSGIGSEDRSGVSAASSACSGAVLGSGGTAGAAGVSPSAATNRTSVGVVPAGAQAARPNALVSARTAMVMRLRFMIPPVGEPVRHPHDRGPDPVQREIVLNRSGPPARVRGVRPTKRGSRVAGHALRPAGLGVVTAVTGGKKCRG